MLDGQTNMASVCLTKRNLKRREDDNKICEGINVMNRQKHRHLKIEKMKNFELTF